VLEKDLMVVNFPSIPVP